MVLLAANTAHLFTKHLVGSDRIQSLLELFGCRYADGRAALARLLRQGAGTEKGELLPVADAPTVEWDGQLYPAVEVEGEFCLTLFCLICRVHMTV